MGDKKVIAAAVPTNVIVHPLVLLSVVDHYNRVFGNTVNADTSGSRVKRVVGVLLGQWIGTTSVNISNSYAIPFEEDESKGKDTVWFLDHNYHENMYQLFKKVSAKERIVGWYHTGPKLKGSDLAINQLFKRYTANPILVVIDVEPKANTLPTESYMAIESISGSKGTESQWAFEHVNSSIEAEEAEEIGVEHLLRDIRDNIPTYTTKTISGDGIGFNKVILSKKIESMYHSLQSLSNELLYIKHYLAQVDAGHYPRNMVILDMIQNIFNLLGNTHIESEDETQSKEWKVAETVLANDQLGMIYLASLSRVIIGLHNLIDNKLVNKESDKLSFDVPVPVITAGAENTNNANNNNSTNINSNTTNNNTNTNTSNNSNNKPV